MRNTIQNFLRGCCVFAVCSLASAQSTDLFSLKKSLGLDLAPVRQVAGGQMQDAQSLAGQTGQQVDKISGLYPKTPQGLDAIANASSQVFGANLFTGAFAKQGPGRFNPDYAISVGDRVHIRLWGGFDFDGVVEVDPKGNIFLPHIGPVMAMGVRNEELQKVVESSVRRIFRANVYSYASLAAAQPVKVFVGGVVNRPGLYNGTSMDSLLSYLDQAGGIDAERGSFLNVQVKRGDRVRATVNLYEFLLDGRIPLVQLAEGDVIFVSPRQGTIKVSGLVSNAKRFEFVGRGKTISEIVSLAKPMPQATHVRVIRNSGPVTNVEYFPLEQAKQIDLQDGDELEFVADKKPGTITVRVQGEHQSPQEYVLPYGARLGELMGRIQYSERSDSEKPQLFRLSVKERQKQLLAIALKTLESSVLTARSGTSSEAALRTEEANLILKWVDKAKTIEPTGQVLIAQASKRNDLLLENGDLIKIHPRDGLVLVGGEVLFPNAIAFDNKYNVDDYIKFAGGFTQNADTSRVVIAHRDGSFDEGGRIGITEGDEILILPKVDIKAREIGKDLMQIIYQMAIAARVVLKF